MLYVDFLGLMKTKDVKNLCKNYKTFWKEKGKYYNPGEGTVKDNWNKLVDGIVGFKVQIDCNDCCSDDTCGKNAGGCTEPKMKQPFSGCGSPKPKVVVGCKITICANTIAKNYSDAQVPEKLLEVFVHELTHCNQIQTSGPVLAGQCVKCLCGEIQAYAKGNPSLSPHAVVDGAAASCNPANKPAWKPKACENTFEISETWIKYKMTGADDSKWDMSFYNACKATGVPP
jgi:hypothetical protein